MPPDALSVRTGSVLPRDRYPHDAAYGFRIPGADGCEGSGYAVYVGRRDSDSAYFPRGWRGRILSAGG